MQVMSFEEIKAEVEKHGTVWQDEEGHWYVDQPKLGDGETEEIAVGMAALALWPKTGVPSDNPPQHPFDVKISIGGDEWDYVVRTLDELAIHIREHGPECGMCSGGGGGSHSVHIRRRQISAEDFRRELSDWFDRRRERKAASDGQ